MRSLQIVRRRWFLGALPLLIVVLLGIWSRPVQAVQPPFERDREQALTGNVVALDWLAFDFDGDPTTRDPELLAVGAQGGATLIIPSAGLRENFLELLTDAAIALPDSNDARDIAWAVEGDRVLLAVARDNGADLVFLVTFDPVTLELRADEIWRGPTDLASTSVAWGDGDDDGLLDLYVGTADASLVIYLATGPLPAGRDYLERQRFGVTGNVSSLSFRPAGGGAPNLLAIGVTDADNPAARSRVFEIDNIEIFAAPIWVAPFGSTAPQVAWGDANGDGSPDLFTAGDGDTLNVYTSDPTGYTLTLTPSWISPSKERTIALAVGDIDGDGDSDIFNLAYVEAIDVPLQTRGQIWRGSRELDGTIRYTDDTWTTFPGPVQLDPPLGAAIFADYSRDGRLDLITSNPQIDFYRNLTNTPFEIQVRLGETEIPGALIFRQRTGDQTHVPFRDPRTGRLLTTNANGQLLLRDDLRAGDSLLVVAPANDSSRTITRALPVSAPPLAIPDQGIITATLQIEDTGTIQDLSFKQLQINHSFLGDLQITLISPAGTRILVIDQACGRNQRINLDVSVTDDALGQTCPFEPDDQIAPLAPFSSLIGEEVRGQWQLEIRDLTPLDTGELVAWQLEFEVGDVPLYYTNAFVFTDGSVGVGRLNAQGVFEPTTANNVLDPQFLAVYEQNPLLLFKLDVALEWDARNDSAFMEQLRFDLTRAAELLYDFTDGQATILQFTIFHDRERWNSADIRIYASNRLRPNADQGGISSGPRPEPNNDRVVYGPGQIRMGSLWNRYGGATGALGEDWPRALAHELGHYLFYLDENYLGIDVEGNVIGIPTPDLLNLPCRGAMYDPYRDDESEFAPNADWLTRCGRTFSQFYTARSDWATITQFYPNLKPPATYNANPGPETMPFALPVIAEFSRGQAPTTLTNNLISTINQDGGRLLATAGSRAILFQGNRAVDLGSPILDQVEARGVRLNDEVCVYDRVRGQAGCSTITAFNARLPVLDLPNWRPDIRIIPVNGTRVRIELLAAGSGLTNERVEAHFYPTDQDAIFSTELVRSGAVYQGEITVLGRNAPIQQGLLRVIVDEPNRTPNGGVLARREAITDYIQHGFAQFGPPSNPQTSAQVANISDPNVQQCGLPGFPPCPTRAAQRTPTPTPRGAPASNDGQATLYGSTDALEPGDFFTFQAATELRQPLPPWSEPVGQGYWLDGTVGIGVRLRTTSFNAAYLERELPPGTQGGLAIFYWDLAQQEWQRLPLTRIDPLRNEITARTRDLGLYALMTTLAPHEGWNLISYPWRTEDRTVQAALARLNVNATHYTTIYGYDDAQQRWQIYDAQVPPEWAPLVNSLQRLDYGRGYWFNVTTAGAVSSQFAPPLSPVIAAQPPPVLALTPTPTATATPTPTATATPRPVRSVPIPPATYYGELSATDTLTPAVGMRVEALINGLVCGSAETQLLNDRIVYVIQVEAEQPGFVGCGSLGRSITWRVEGLELPFRAVWDNAQASELSLIGRADTWLPLVGR
jgi:subtilisin-like proprotein convertase family protein